MRLRLREVETVNGVAQEELVITIAVTSHCEAEFAPAIYRPAVLEYLDEEQYDNRAACYGVWCPVEFELLEKTRRYTDGKG